MRRTIQLLGILIGVVILVVLGFALLFNANRFKPTLESDLSSALNRDVTLGNLSLSIFSGAITAADLSIADDPAFSKSPFLRAKTVNVGVEMMPLIFSRRLHVTGITIDQPEITLLQTPAGNWNASSLGTKSGAKPAHAEETAAGAGNESLDLFVNALNINNGRLTIGRTSGRWKPLVLDQVNLQVQNFSSTSVFPFSLATKVSGGGTVKLDGKAGPLNATDASKIPVTAKLSVTSLDLAGSGLNDYAPDVAGVISVEGSGESNGNDATLQGKIAAEKLKLARNGAPAETPVEFDFVAQHNLRKHSGVLSRGDIHIGKAGAKLTGDYFEQADSMNVKMSLLGSGMPVTDIVNMLPSLGIVLPAGSSLKGGTFEARVALEGPTDRLVTSGTVALVNTKLAGFDLAKKMSAIEQLAGLRANPDTDIQTASTNLQMSPAGISAQDIKLVVPTLGELHGGGTVSPAQALNFKMSATIHGSGLTAALGNASIPFKVEGTSSNPVFSPDIKAFATQGLKALESDPRNAGSILKGLLGGKKD